jgi:uncharacterized membrane protein
MATQKADDTTRRYLRRLEKELGDFPAVYRDEVVDEIREHIADSSASAESEADMLAVLDRLGDPKSIADDARERFGLRSPQAGTTEVAALFLFLFSFSIVGYIVAAVLVWKSSAWRRRDKIIGIVAPIVVGPLVVFASAELLAHGSGLPFFALIFAWPVLTPAYLAATMRNRQRRVAVWAWLPVAIAVVPLALVIVLSAQHGALSGTSSLGSYMVVNGQHVCWVGASTDSEKQVPCNSVPPPGGGWNFLEKHGFTTGYDYAIVGNGQHQCTVDTPMGIFQQTSCDAIPPPPGGWEVVAASQQSSNCVGDEAHCLFVATAAPVVPPTTYPTP